MPLTRYQIRNEYGLADPELYRAADRDDPEALLEGVAMAGLVGVLRQLGDLAEFAAEIFHNLHEEVMTTSARGHSLMARVQQLEAEVPSVEKAFLSQTDHSSFFTNGASVDWRPNLHMEQNLITQGDLPRFVMDSYEECRGPPRLFLLDKFDVAGAGACLKRYTDPSIFKIEAPTFTTMEAQREKKARKIKKKGTRWRNGDTPEVMPASHAKLHQLFLEERVANGHSDPARIVKLKRRQLNGSPFNMKSGKSYMEKFLKTPSPDNKAMCEPSVNPPFSTSTQDYYSESGLEIVEITAVSPTEQLVQDKGSNCSSPVAQDSADQHIHDDFDGKDTSKWIVKASDTIADCETDESAVHEMPTGKELTLYAGGKTNSLEGDQSDDMISEVDNYMDALTTMESELESDNEFKSKSHGTLKWVSRQAQSGISEQRPVSQAKFLNSLSYGNSSVSDDGNSSLYKGGSSISYTDSLGNVAENVQSDGEGLSKISPSMEDSVALTSILQSDNSSSQLGSCEDQSRELEVPTDICSQEENIQEPERVSSGSLAESLISTLMASVPVADASGDLLAGELSDDRIRGKEVSSELGALDLETNGKMEDPSTASSDILCQIKYVVPATVLADSNAVDDLEQEDPIALPDDFGSASYVSDLDYVERSHGDSMHKTDITNYSGDTGNSDLEENDFPNSTLSSQVEVGNMAEATDVTDSSVTFKKDPTSEFGLLKDEQKAEAIVAVSETEEISKSTCDLRNLGVAIGDTVISERSYEHSDESRPHEPANLDNILAETDQPKDVLGSIPSDIQGHTNENLSLSSDLNCSPSRHHADMQESLSCSDGQHQTGADLHHKIPSEASPKAEAIKEVIPNRIELGPVESVSANSSEPDAIVHVHHAASVEQDNVSVVDVCTEQASVFSGTVLASQHAYTSEEISAGDGCMPISHLPQAGSSERSARLHDDQFISESVLVEEGTFESEQISKYSAHLDVATPHPSFIADPVIPSEQAWDLQSDQTNKNCLEQDEAGSSSSNLPDRESNLDGLSLISVVSPSSHEPLMAPTDQNLYGANLAGNTFGFAPIGLGAVPSTEDLSGDGMPPMPPLPLPPMQWRMGKSPLQPCGADERPERGLDAEGMQRPMDLGVTNNVEDSQEIPHSIGIPLQPNPLFVEFPVDNTVKIQKDTHSSEALGHLNPFLTSEEVSNNGPEISDLPSEDVKRSSPDSFPFTVFEDNAPSKPDIAPSSQVQAELSLNGLASKPALGPELAEHCVESTGRGPVDALREDSLPVEKEQLQKNVVTSYGGTSWPPTTLTLPPSYELGKANGHKLPRPRNPLMDAVAAIDKSKLRKAAERVQPQAGPKAEERDTLLEQIRTKSFNLKPAATARPNMRPSMPGIHDLRVAAIYEKANSIRQALVGSDEDDDDSWSDS